MGKLKWRTSVASLLLLLALPALGGAAYAYFPLSSASAPIRALPTMLSPASGQTSLRPVGAQAEAVDCSQLDELGITKQMNMHAALIVARCAGIQKTPPAGRQPSAGAGLPGMFDALRGPLLPSLGGTDSDIILPDGTFPHIGQSESMVWGHGSTVVNNYNDARGAPDCAAGLSYSTDGGASWTRIGGAGASPICSGHGTNFGDPVVVYNQALGLWFAGDIATGCDGQGIGLWTSSDGISWTVGACAHNGSGDDRESMWVDNSPASPHYGRMYISFNNFGTGGGGALQVAHSDNGTTWSTPSTLDASFIRDVQATGDVLGSGTVYVAAMDEGPDGGLATRQNVIYRSTDGGVLWSSAATGPRFPGPGRAVADYFATMFSTIWRHMGWGQPAAVGNVVHYVYAQCGGGFPCDNASDHGDIYYVRSTDAGVTWSTPVKLNTDSGTAMQWQPSLAATSQGAVYASWYDEREVNGGNDLDCTPGNAAQPCYRRYGRLSLDNGATWQADTAVGDVNSPLPDQPDDLVEPTYEGDYDYIVANGTNIYDHWTDGRVTINGQSQQDVFEDTINGSVGTPTPTVTGTPPTSTATGTATATPTPVNNCGNLMIVDSQPVGFTPNPPAFQVIANNLVQYTYSQSHLAPHDFALFQTHDPWGSTVIKDWITANGYSYDVFTPSQLPGFDFHAYRVVLLNWDQDQTSDFDPPYSQVIPDLEAYVQTGGVLWIQSGWLGQPDTYPLPFGSTMAIDFEANNFIDDPGHPAVQGVPNPFSGNYASMGVESNLPPGATIITSVGTSTGGAPTMFEVRPGACATATITPPTYTATATAVPPTATATGTATAAPPTETTTVTPTGTASSVPRTETETATQELATRTATETATTATNTPVPGTATTTATACTIQFSDVPVGSTFHPYIHCLACLGIINGYPDGTFKPNNQVTRGQLAKIVSNSAGFHDNQTTQLFQDVLVGSTFFQYVGRLASRGYMSGYPCGGSGEPCGPNELPYFRPNNNATRGQISKIVSNAAGFNDPQDTQLFQDVPVGSTYYTYTARLTSRNIMSGYVCGGAGEPCVPPANLPYFRPNNNATRGQTSKIVANTFFSDCQTPALK